MKIIKIKSCRECPNSYWPVWAGTAAACRITMKIIDHSKEIPTWCPLEDSCED